VAIVIGDVAREGVAAAVESLNAELPHYRRIHRFHIEREPLTIESGMLTANGKLRRDAIGGAIRGPDRDVLPREERERMNSFSGKTISWSLRDSVIELVLHRAPANEIGTETLGELEQFMVSSAR